jgi:hypothetical protein
MIPQDVVNAIHDAAQKFQVDPALVFAVAENESGFRQSAVSRVGALGVMQVMPDTQGGTTRTINGVVYDLTDTVQNIQAGVAYLATLQSQFGSNTTDIIAAYNAGPGRVTQYGGGQNIPYPETRSYLANVKASYAKYKGQVGNLVSDTGFVIGDQLPGYNQVVWPGKTYQTPINLNPFDPAYWGGDNNFGNIGVDANGNIVINNKTPDAVAPIVDAGSEQEKAFAKVDTAAAKNANKPDGWQGFISDTVHGIETNLLLGGLVLGLLAGGFMLIASDNPQATKNVAKLAAG